MFSSRMAASSRVTPSLVGNALCKVSRTVGFKAVSWENLIAYLRQNGFSQLDAKSLETQMEAALEHLMTIGTVISPRCDFYFPTSFQDQAINRSHSKKMLHPTPPPNQPMPWNPNFYPPPAPINWYPPISPPRNRSQSTDGASWPNRAPPIQLENSPYPDRSIEIPVSTSQKTKETSSTKAAALEKRKKADGTNSKIVSTTASESKLESTSKSKGSLSCEEESTSEETTSTSRTRTASDDLPSVFRTLNVEPQEFRRFVIKVKEANDDVVEIPSGDSRENSHVGGEKSTA